MINIEIDDKALADVLKKAEKNLADTSPLMRAIAGALKTKMDMNIRMGISAEDQPFIPLAQSTIKQRTKKKKWPGQILQLSGELNKKTEVDSGNGYAAIGSLLPYARRQQLGDKKPDKRGLMLPARPYMPITGDGKLQKSVEGIILGLVQKHLEPR